MRAKASKAQAAQSMLKRAEKMLEGVEGERAADQALAALGLDPVRAPGDSEA